MSVVCWPTVPSCRWLGVFFNPLDNLCQSLSVPGAHFNYAQFLLTVSHDVIETNNGVKLKT